MKKILVSFLLSIVIIFSIVVVSEAANISVSGETVSTYPGETVSIRFTTSGISESNPLGAFEASKGNFPSGITLNSMNSSLGEYSNGSVSWIESNLISGERP